MNKNSNKRTASFDPVNCLASIFTARRDLLEPIHQWVMDEAPVTTDEADVLIYLYGNQELGWANLTADAEGFVSTGDLRQVVVHDRGLFSRRIQKLQQAGFIEGKQPTENRRGSRRYIYGVRITKAGIEAAKRIWGRYRNLAAKLLADVPQADLKIHCRVNEHIHQAVRELKKSSQVLLD